MPLPPTDPAPDPDLSPQEVARYSRHLIMPQVGMAGQLRLKAAKNGSVLRYIGRVENGAASVSLQAVDSNHPFYSLSGSDNIISFVTKRYFERPLVVKGPGAGNDVTAAGTFADIIRTASYLG